MGLKPKSRTSFEVVSRRDTRKSTVFSSLFSPSKPVATNSDSQSTTPQRSPSPPHMRSSSPNVYLDDPAFSKDPRQNPLFVANPDPQAPGIPHFSYSSSSSSTSNSSSETAASSATSISEKELLKKGPIVLTYDPETSTELTLASDGTVISAIPIPTEPPPPYRPTASRHSSAPVLPQQTPQRIEPPARAASAPVLQSHSPNRKKLERGLDPIDEMDESNPFGVSLHQSGPFDVVRAVTRPQNGQTSSLPRDGYTNKHLKHSFDPVPSVPYIPFAGPLGLSPGQILPKNLSAQPRPTPQSHSSPSSSTSYQAGHLRAHTSDHLTNQPHAYHLKPPAASRPNPGLTLRPKTPNQVNTVDSSPLSPPLPTPNYPVPASPSPFPLPSPGFPPTPVTPQHPQPEAYPGPSQQESRAPQIQVQTQTQQLKPPEPASHAKFTSSSSTASYHSSVTSPIAHSPSASSFHTIDAYGGIDEESDSPQFEQQATAYSDMKMKEKDDINIRLSEETKLRDEDYDLPSYAVYQTRPSIEQSHSPYSLLDDKDAVEKHAGSGGYFPVVPEASGSGSRHTREAANHRREATAPALTSAQPRRPLYDEPVNDIPADSRTPIPPHRRPHQLNGILKTSRHQSMPAPNTPVQDGFNPLPPQQQQRGYGEPGPSTYQNQQQHPYPQQRPQPQLQRSLPPGAAPPDHAGNGHYPIHQQQQQHPPPLPNQHVYQHQHQQQPQYYPPPSNQQPSLQHPPPPPQQQYLQHIQNIPPPVRDPSIHPSINSVNGSQLPRHAPKHLVMPMPLQGQGQQGVRFQAPPTPHRPNHYHNNNNNNSHPSQYHSQHPNLNQNQQHPLQRKHTYTLPSSLVPTPGQTQNRAVSSPLPPPAPSHHGKVLKKRGSMSGPVPSVSSSGRMNTVVGVSRSKTDVGSGVSKKVPKRVLSKRRTDL
ncbi:hypothetical protein VNI00_001789 [Paramarasmius palmivorus]|uniref:Uncharacterized protein n=1 Tax=Paramarasmius palmivorus TaxID=297713 RepID=A0AAW0E2R2_9AGAR